MTLCASKKGLRSQSAHGFRICLGSPDALRLDLVLTVVSDPRFPAGRGRLTVIAARCPQPVVSYLRL